jgi:uncharacterized ion transporter superfamily protein YfcC
VAQGFFQRLRIPHVFTLLTAIILLASLSTYVVPSGSYDRETRKVEGRERTLVVPGTYQKIPKSYSARGVLLGGEAEDDAERAAPVSLHGFLTAIPRGLEQSADIIFFIFIIGGVFGILQRTGTINACIHELLKHLGHSGPLLTIVIMVAVSVGGSTLGMGEEFIPLVPIFLMISKRMGYDRIYGLALVMLAADIGFASATTNPFTVNIAQGIAELQLNSGIRFRIVFYLFAISMTIGYVLRYGARIRRDPSASVMADDAFEIEEPAEEIRFDRRHLAILIACLLIFVGILYCVQTLGWWMADMAGGFFLMGLVAMVVARLPLRDGTAAFVRGMEEMVVAALVVGFARGIQVVLMDGQILDTVIHSAATVLGQVPRYVAVEGMLLFQTTLNFLIPSGSGQAAVTMPLMAPLSDVLGITRQTAVFAFQCGDGFSNTIVPTSGVLMAMLTLARIPYERWLRFVLPLFLALLVLSGVFLVVAVAVGYS